MSGENLVYIEVRYRWVVRSIHCGNKKLHQNDGLIKCVLCFSEIHTNLLLWRYCADKITLTLFIAKRVQTLNIS
ncbi:transposase (IS652) [Legionella cincinnatiensis]|uniref:Transposase (IS652) n=1 Tax=Legionella cincinnatiensis TaxID=28085 RepID=A0A378IQG4_9GAMM|nr:transposase (IS652) [Legionella cincinnatiensis]STX34254.1 transposase (IS652) [Legionella cincinnatiensis]